MPALVLLHAFPLDRSMWEHDFLMLHDAAYPIASPSFPGFGGTVVPREQPTLDDYADAVIRVMDGVPVDRAAIAGLSMGGYVAFALWRRYRDRVAGLAFIDTKAEADTPEAAQNRHRLAATVREHGVESLLKTPPKWLRDDSPRWPALKKIIRAQDKEAVAQACIAMAGRPDSTPDLATIDVPTAVIVGEADAITPLANSKTIADGVKDATLAVIPDAGHISNVEAPDAFERAIRDWLRRVR